MRRTTNRVFKILCLIRAGDIFAKLLSRLYLGAFCTDFTKLVSLIEQSWDALRALLATEIHELRWKMLMRNWKAKLIIFSRQLCQWRFPFGEERDNGRFQCDALASKWLFGWSVLAEYGTVAARRGRVWKCHSSTGRIHRLVLGACKGEN